MNLINEIKDDRDTLIIHPKAPQISDQIRPGEVDVRVVRALVVSLR
jgi:hypothetical protein